MWRESALVCFVTLWFFASMLNGWIVRRFVFSKPPSRRMITTDMSVMLILLGNVHIMAICVTVALRTIHGPLPFYVVVAIKQFHEILFTLTMGTSNVTAFLQIILILKPRLVVRFGLLYQSQSAV